MLLVVPAPIALRLIFAAAEIVGIALTLVYSITKSSIAVVGRLPEPVVGDKVLIRIQTGVLWLFTAAGRRTTTLSLLYTWFPVTSGAPKIGVTAVKAVGVAPIP